MQPTRASAASLAGRWVYRSFIDSPDAAESFDKLRLAVATFDLQAEAGGAFTGAATTERWRLNLAGQVDGNGRATMRATQGDANTAGWHYEYVGWIVPHWAEATQPRPTFVGSVLRVADHDNLRGGISKGGLTYSFVAVKS